MWQPAVVRGRPGPRARVGIGSRLLIFSALFLLLFPCLQGWPRASKGEVLVLRKERWRLCGSMALDPKDKKWSCCRGFYPFHRPTQRCCQTWGKFLVIPMDPEKSEAEDCRMYTQKALGQPVHLPSESYLGGEAKTLTPTRCFECDSPRPGP